MLIDWRENAGFLLIDTISNFSSTSLGFNFVGKLENNFSGCFSDIELAASDSFDLRLHLLLNLLEVSKCDLVVGVHT
jgi:hypothetical protein